MGFHIHQLKTMLPKKMDCLITTSEISQINFLTVSGEPPRKAYTFNVPNDEGEISGQVFSYITLFRLIGTPGEDDAKYFVYHPITRERIRRDQALAFVLPVSIEIQERIN
jgi:hypothetical protein